MHVDPYSRRQLVVLCALALHVPACAAAPSGEPSLDVGASELSVTLVATGSTWRYLDNGSDQGTAWRAPSFDDSGWRSGAAELGYGDGDERTVVSYGPSASSKYITTYFRRAFDVADPTACTGLTLRIRRDDGAVVYLNGVEVFRTSMPTGAITYTTRAADAGSETTFYSTTLTPSTLVSGRNVLAVEVHQTDPASSDISFDLDLVAALRDTDSGMAMSDGGTDAGGSSALVARGATWRYLDNGTDQGTAWRASSFDDSSWRSGAAELGYGDGDERTVVSYGPNASSKYITTYFRRAFDVAVPTEYTGLTLAIRRDDGAVVYLNGAEVFRTSMPTGTIAYTTRALDAGSETTFYTATLATSRLVAGRNVLAVEVHQSDPASSDISFDLGLDATTSTSTDAGTSDAGPAPGGVGLEDGLLFDSTSPFNSPIPSGATLDPRSATIAAGIRDAVATRGGIIIWSHWSVPLYFVRGSTTPRYSVHETRFPVPGTTYLDNVPIPDGALPDPGGSSDTDGHMVIIDTDAASPTYRCMYDFFEAVRHTDGSWSSGAISRTWADNGNYDHGEGMGPRGSSFAAAAGLIRPEELRDGYINHALFFAYGRNQAGGPVPPSLVSDGSYTGADALPEGGRIRLRPGVDLSSLPRHWQIIGRALQEYGAFDGDNSGGDFSIGALNNVVSPLAWGYGVAYPWGSEAYPAIPRLITDNLEVLTLGPQVPNDFTSPPLVHPCGNYR